MTPIQTLTIPTCDIHFVNIACKHCGSIMRLTVPREDIPKNACCMGCDKPFWTQDDADHRIVLGFFRTLDALCKLRKEVNFKIDIVLEG